MRRAFFLLCSVFRNEIFIKILKTLPNTRNERILLDLKEDRHYLCDLGKVVIFIGEFSINTRAL
jgi:hypothetical protein